MVAQFSMVKQSYSSSTALAPNCALNQLVRIELPRYSLCGTIYLAITITTPALVTLMNSAPLFCMQYIEAVDASGRTYFRQEPQNAWLEIMQTWTSSRKLAAKQLCGMNTGQMATAPNGPGTTNTYYVPLVGFPSNAHSGGGTSVIDTRSLAGPLNFNLQFLSADNWATATGTGVVGNCVINAVSIQAEVWDLNATSLASYIAITGKPRSIFTRSWEQQTFFIPSNVVGNTTNVVATCNLTAFSGACSTLYAMVFADALADGSRTTALPYIDYTLMVSGVTIIDHNTILQGQLDLSRFWPVGPFGGLNDVSLGNVCNISFQLPGMSTVVNGSVGSLPFRGTVNPQLILTLPPSTVNRRVYVASNIITLLNYIGTYGAFGLRVTTDTAM